MDGFQTALLVAAGIAIAGAIVAFTLVRPHEGAGDRDRPPAAAGISRLIGLSSRARGPKGDLFARRPVATESVHGQGRGPRGGKQ